MSSSCSDLIQGYFFQTTNKFKYLTDFVPNNHHLNWNSSPITTPSPSLNLDFMPVKNLKIQATSPHGLLLCVSNMSQNHEYYVCKPTTKQYEKIPDPKTNSPADATAMVVKSTDPLHYKIVRFVLPETGFHYKVEIFDSKSEEWKVSNNVGPPNLVLTDRGSSIFLHGAFHFLTSENNIFAFYVDNERWELIRLPQNAYRMNKRLGVCKSLVEFEGSLAVMYVDGDRLQVWVESFSNQLWECRRNLRISPQFKSSLLLDMYDEDTVLMKDSKKLIWYNCQTCTSNREVVLKQQRNVQYFHYFISDFTPLRFKVAREET